MEKQSSDDHALEQLQGELRYWFRDKDLLVAALTHSTYAKELQDADPASNVERNDRLAFLGDAVIGLVVARALFDNGMILKGTMTKERQTFVNNEELARLGRTLELDQVLRTGGSEKGDGGKTKRLATALEALVGAVFLDCCLECASRVFMGLRPDIRHPR